MDNTSINQPRYGSRIIYKPSGIPNILTSSEAFILYVHGNAKHYRSYLDLVNKKWFIREEKGSEIVLEGSGTSKHKLMIKAKSALVKLGIKFEPETRRKISDGKEE